MLTPNVNQFIPQDFYSSLPTTLDAKKSPLALLAQTCSQIGNDSSNSKTMPSQTEEKLNKAHDKSSPSSSSNGSSPVSTTKSSFKPYESCLKDSDQRTSERKVSPPKMVSDSNASTNSSSSPMACSPGAQRTPTTSEHSRTVSSPATSSPQSTKPADAITSLKSLSLPVSSSAHYIPNYPCLPLDVMTSSLLPSHSLKAGVHPYLSYSRLKTASSAADSMVAVCRDPYCTNCQLSSHLLAASTGTGTGTGNGNGKSCPPGCTQCDIVKSPNLLTGSHGTTLATAYAQAQLAALAAASQMPYICSWVGTDTAYCGKRFVTSEELLQHLRTHTSDSLLNASATHSLLNRTYPTPPLSPLSTARYHPYSKPHFLPPSLFPMPASPALHPPFPPYLFYNSKLGSMTPHQ